MKMRTRIAPSPTGELHMGHLRTLLYDYALAKKSGGQFIVRIEDTDRNRYVEGSMERTLQVIRDYGMTWDEGPEVGGPYAPYLQSERLDIYKEHAKKLVDMGHAYYCFCTPERLSQMREEQQKQGAAKTTYDKLCRSLSAEEVQKNLADGKPYVIRLKVPENETVTLHDVVHGDIDFNTSELDDAILLKSDGFPTYHLAAMVDDHLMNITHVLRGIDWMPSSPLHILLYRFFGWETPAFVHLPNIKEKGSNRKLGKRFGSVAAAEFLNEGYLPEAMLNLLMFVGWNPGSDKEIYSLEEFVNDFSLEKIQKTDLVVFDRDRLLWLNGYYIRNKPLADLWSYLKAWAVRTDVSLNGTTSSEDFNKKVLDLVRDRMKKLSEFNQLTNYFYTFTDVPEDLLVGFTSGKDRAVQIIKTFKDLYASVDVSLWNRENLDKISHEVLLPNGFTAKEAFMTLRSVFTGETATPPIFDILEILGKEESLKRIDSSLAVLKA